MGRRQKESPGQRFWGCRVFFAVAVLVGVSSILGGCSVQDNFLKEMFKRYGWEDGQSRESAENMDGQTKEALENSDGQGDETAGNLDGQTEEPAENPDGQVGESVKNPDGQGRESAKNPDIGREEFSKMPGLEEKQPQFEEEVKLPRRFDYRDVGKQPPVRNQGKFGTCWAFSSLMAIESSLLPKESWTFSADHMSRKNSFSMGQEDGGQYAMSMAYLLAWQGPVLEADDPYGDGTSPDGLTPVKHVREIRILESKNYQEIKRAVYQTGGVQSSLFTNLKDYTSRDQYYNEETCSYYYSGQEKPNHNVVIIGWDDDYPKENFRQQPRENGAFICQNSWGTRFGEQGCFYVSYEDTNIGDTNVLYSRIESPALGARIYQSDLCGWIGQIGYGEEDAYFSAVYQAAGSEYLTSVGFYATMPDTSYRVYAAQADSPRKVKLNHPAAQGSFKEAGFYTVDFLEPVRLEPGERFTVVVDIHTPGAVHPVAIEYQAPDLVGQVDLTDGEGYLSSDGKNWISAEQNQNCNLCLKAYTLPAD